MIVNLLTMIHPQPTQFNCLPNMTISRFVSHYICVPINHNPSHGVQLSSHQVPANLLPPSLQVPANLLPSRHQHFRYTVDLSKSLLIRTWLSLIKEESIYQAFKQLAWSSVHTAAPFE